MTSDPDLKIPVFLLNIAPSIFKAGTSVYLLKKGGRHPGVDQLAMQEYYQICCGAAINKFYTKLANREMKLDF